MEVDGVLYAEAAESNNTIVYNFIDNELLSSVSLNPVLNNLKNDYSIWGKRKGVGNVDIPIHYRYAIDFKPTSYTTIRENTNINYSIDQYDWRELIY